MTAMDIPALENFVATQFPEAQGFCQLKHLTAQSLMVHLPFRPEMLRPGGTVSGPTLMTLADLAAYFLILSRIGPVALTVTTNLNIHFFHKPSASDLMAEARLLKLGKRIAVCDMHMRNVGSDVLVAQATASYAIPRV
jgi:uncharacterized protein (TIGR00369 family)